MSEKAQVALLTEGKVKIYPGSEKSREAVLSLPLSKLIVKMVRVPAGEDAVEVATPILKAMSPYPDEPLTVSCEKVCEDERGECVLAAALPESATDDFAELLDAQKLNLTRVDATALGQLRASWSQIAGTEDGARRLVKIKSPDCLSLFVLDGAMPCAVRAITDESELERETMMLLLEAEDFGGPKELVGTVEIDTDDAIAAEGIAERSADPAALNALPESWGEVLEESRFKAKLVKYLAIAGGLWLLVMGVLIGVPFVFGFMTDYQKGLSKQHSRQYREVKDMKAKVELISKYSDHGRGALEIMKAISDRLPEGITLSTWDYRSADGLKIAGEAESSSDVYTLKDVLAALTAGDDEGERVFKQVSMGPISSAKGGKQRFTLDLSFKDEETAGNE